MTRKGTKKPRPFIIQLLKPSIKLNQNKLKLIFLVSSQWCRWRSKSRRKTQGRLNYHSNYYFFKTSLTLYGPLNIRPLNKKKLIERNSQSIQMLGKHRVKFRRDWSSTKSQYWTKNGS